MFNNKQPIRSYYADGILVFEGQEPPRLAGGDRPFPDPDATGSHCRLRWDTINHRIYQAREFDSNGYPICDIDFTSPTYSNGIPRSNHALPPHQHLWQVNDTHIGPRSGFKRQGGGGSPLKLPKL